MDRGIIVRLRSGVPVLYSPRREPSIRATWKSESWVPAWWAASLERFSRVPDIAWSSAIRATRRNWKSWRRKPARTHGPARRPRQSPVPMRSC